MGELNRNWFLRPSPLSTESEVFIIIVNALGGGRKKPKNHELGFKCLFPLSVTEGIQQKETNVQE